MVTHQRTFGYTTEELKVLIGPMARTGAEPIGSMGTDTPVAVLSDRSRLLFDYFQQLFAQVTNPPLDAIREELVTSMGSTLGPEGNLLEPGPASCRQVVLPYPIITNAELAKLLYINDDGDMPGFKPFAIDGLYPVAEGGEGLRRAIEDVRTRVSAAIADGAKVIVLSDRYSSEDMAPIPSLLLTAAVHHHLIREKTRTTSLTRLTSRKLEMWVISLCPTGQIESCGLPSSGRPAPSSTRPSSAWPTGRWRV